MKTQRFFAGVRSAIANLLFSLAQLVEGEAPSYQDVKKEIALLSNEIKQIDYESTNSSCTCRESVREN